MEYIDLSNQTSENYEGKIIEVNGCQYAIGPHVKTGSSYIIHRLINDESGLSQHVIKIVCDPVQEKSSLYLKEPPHKLAELFQYVLYFIRLEYFGDIVYIQPAVGPYLPYYEDMIGYTDETMAYAERLSDELKLNEAALLYEQILQTNTSHTAALYNLASIQVKLGNHDAAFQLCMKAVSIEPNCIQYYIALIKQAEMCGYLPQAIEQFEKMKKNFPYNCELDHLGINLYLQFGKPEQAKEFLKNAFLFTEDEIMDCKAKITEEIESKKKAFELVEQAEKALPDSVTPKILGVDFRKGT